MIDHLKRSEMFRASLLSSTAVDRVPLGLFPLMKDGAKEHPVRGNLDHLKPTKTESPGE